MPTPVQKDFHAAREIHRRIDRRHADIPQITGGVTRRDAHRPAERDGQVGHVTAHSLPFAIRLQRGLGGTCELIAEGHVPVHVVADGLDPRPSGRQMAEQQQRIRRQHIAFAVTAGQRVHQRLVRQGTDRRLARVRKFRFGHPRVLEQAVGRHAKTAGRGHQPGTDIAEYVPVVLQRNHGVGPDEVANEQALSLVGDGGQKQHHRCRLRTVVNEFVAKADLHTSP